ncbi:hypothetical protein ACTWQF_18195 [Streptomyces sp. 8N114]|uniref:hypothetical protein n=1 Tax=Streptomyces sp. 8N114 TaxID=3457419 RepID=UPI003FD41815
MPATASGAAAARKPAAQGEEAVLEGRSPAKTAAAAQELSARHYTAGFADLAQVRDLADKLRLPARTPTYSPTTPVASWEAPAR